MNSKPLEERVSYLEGKIEGSLEQINKRLESLEHRVEALDRKMDEKIDKINERLWQIILLIIASLIVPILLRLLFP